MKDEGYKKIKKIMYKGNIVLRVCNVMYVSCVQQGKERFKGRSRGSELINTNTAFLLGVEGVVCGPKGTHLSGGCVLSKLG
jgi:hypothetical protein